jgi:hypothetical protein
MFLAALCGCDKDERTESEKKTERKAAKAARTAAEAYRKATLDQRTRPDGTVELPDMVAMGRAAEDAYRAVMAESAMPGLRVKSSVATLAVVRVAERRVSAENLAAAEELKTQAKKLLKQALKAKDAGALPSAADILFSEVFAAMKEGQARGSAVRDILDMLLDGTQMGDATAEKLARATAAVKALRREIKAAEERGVSVTG